MFGKMKRWLGIEGVKIELIVPETASKKSKKVDGIINLSTMHPQKIDKLHVKMIEIYKRGRKEEKRIDEYLIGEIFMNEEIEVLSDELIEIEFTLPFELIKSEIEAFGDKNFLAKGISNLAKRSNAVNSTYRIEAEVFIKGTRLNPYDKKTIKLK